MPPAAPPRNRSAAYQTNGPLLPSRATIYVNIYRLFPASKYLEPIGWGIHHSGVEVFGVEYGYGRGPEGTGLFQVPPRSYGVGECRETVELGETMLSEREVELVMEELEQITLPPLLRQSAITDRQSINSPHSSTQPLVSTPVGSQENGESYMSTSPPPPGHRAEAGNTIQNKNTNTTATSASKPSKSDPLAKQRPKNHHHLVWQGQAYHLMLHNCNSFSEVLAEILLTFVPFSERIVPIVAAPQGQPSSRNGSPIRANVSPPRGASTTPTPPISGITMAAFAPVTPIRETSDMLPYASTGSHRNNSARQYDSISGGNTTTSTSNGDSGSYSDIVFQNAGEGGKILGLAMGSLGREAQEAAQMAQEDLAMREHIRAQLLSFVPKKDRLRAHNCCCGTCNSCCPPCFSHCCCGCCCPCLCWGTCDGCGQEEYWYTTTKSHRLPAERVRLERLIEGYGGQSQSTSQNHEGYQFRPFPMNVNRISNIGAFLLPACLIKRIDDVDVNMQAQMLESMCVPAPVNIME